jgi:mannose-6-phosphate isomerase-like protein (cupin superfamily)
MEVDQKLLEEALRTAGFRHTYVWQDGPYAFYSNHTHPVETAHIILDGEMTLTQGNETKTYYAGDRCDVPAGEIHAAKMGLHGCRYLVGEK